MVANIDKLNTQTLQILPLSNVDVTELVKELHARKVSIDSIEVLYNSLDDYDYGRFKERDGMED